MKSKPEIKYLNREEVQKIITSFGCQGCGGDLAKFAIGLYDDLPEMVEQICSLAIEDKSEVVAEGIVSESIFGTREISMNEIKIAMTVNDIAMAVNDLLDKYNGKKVRIIVEEI
jgi:hypothetical protein